MPTGSYLEGADVGNHHRLRVWILTTSRMRIPSAYHDQLYDRFASDKHLGSNRFGNSPSPWMIIGVLGLQALVFMTLTRVQNTEIIPHFERQQLKSKQQVRHYHPAALSNETSRASEISSEIAANFLPENER